MKVAKLLAWIGVIAMTVVLLNGFINGNFGQDGGELLANPWGIVSLIDLYVGLCFFPCGLPFGRKISLQQLSGSF